jgi:hypothetical protein
VSERAGIELGPRGIRLLSARAFDSRWRCAECGATGVHAIINGWICWACRGDSEAEREIRRWVTALVWLRRPCACSDPDIEDPGPSHAPACPWRDPEYDGGGT